MSGFLFNATRVRLPSQGAVPDTFLAELLAWAQLRAPDEIFALNVQSGDILDLLRREIVGQWDGTPGTPEWIRHRKAAMLAHAVVHAGFESGWDWKCGADATNARSLAHPECAETGAWQVSFDSLGLEHGGTTLNDCVRAWCAGSRDVRLFLDRMKSDHDFAIEYYFRLVRISTHWAGPINKWWTIGSTTVAAITEWKQLLSAPVTTIQPAP